MVGRTPEHMRFVHIEQPSQPTAPTSARLTELGERPFKPHTAPSILGFVGPNNGSSADAREYPHQPNGSID